MLHFAGLGTFLCHSCSFVLFYFSVILKIFLPLEIHQYPHGGDKVDGDTHQVQLPFHVY